MVQPITDEIILRAIDSGLSPLGDGPKLAISSFLEQSFSERGDKTPAQIAFNWLLTKSNIIFPIPRASRPERLLRTQMQ